MAEAPHQSWPSYSELLKNWQTFIDRQIIEAGVDLHVARSWQRCYPRSNPTRQLVRSQTSTGFLNTIDSNAAIRTVGRRTLEDIYEFMEGTGSALVLVNSAGYILEMLGDPEMLQELDGRGIRRGTLYAESHMGTSAFSIALTDGVPARVRGPEHFFMHHHDLADAASPLFDINGRPLGAVGIINRFEQHQPHTLSLTVAMAQTILAQRGMDQLLAEQNSQVAQMNAVLETVDEGIMIWNPERRLIHMNEAAEKILGVARSLAMGKNYREILSLPSWLEAMFQEREPVDHLNATVHIANHALPLRISASYLQPKTEAQCVVVSFNRDGNPESGGDLLSGPAEANLNEWLPGSTSALRRARNLARTASMARASVLIRGERGTGKNTLAHAIHKAGARRDEPFIIIPCGSITPERMVVELLGPRPAGPEPWSELGRLEMAQGGTAYFQDVELLGPEAQAVLLDMLQLGVIRHPEHNRPISLDVRVLASSTADLRSLVRDGSFRSELYYHLSVFEILLPPLRERREDLPELVERMLKKASMQFNIPLQMTTEAMDVLMQYDWPRNLHELSAVLQLAASRTSGQAEVTPAHLPDFVFRREMQERMGLLPHISSLQEIEREAVIQSARQTHGNVTQMAVKLGISRTTVWRKLREFEIAVADFRERRQ